MFASPYKITFDGADNKGQEKGALKSLIKENKRSTWIWGGGGGYGEEGMVWIIRKSGGYLSSKGIFSEESGRS